VRTQRHQAFEEGLKNEIEVHIRNFVRQYLHFTIVEWYNVLYTFIAHN
jgi:hypothetical protein